MKFSPLNVDFDGPSLDFLGSRKPAHKSIKEGYPRKSRYFTVVGQFFVKTAGDTDSLRTVCPLAFARLVSLSSNFLLYFRNPGIGSPPIPGIRNPGDCNP